MFKRVIVFLFLATMFLFGVYDKPLFEEYETTLNTVENSRAVIDDSPSIVVGSSGIVLYTFENQESMIIARATVISKDGKQAVLELIPFDSLSQNNFPKISIEPKEGNIVILNYLYRRSLIVTPNYESFKKITDFFINIEWIHPDTIAAFLAKRYIPNPNRKRFREMCSINMAGLIAFNMENMGYFVDCVSFKVVKAFKMPIENEKTVLPFYSRISEHIGTPPISLGTREITDYSEYYRHLLEIK
ncbi:MAG: plasminogen-binding N-terminal domain-containing protein [Campylobacteraceae bacterium]|nr:plasminogen-binding N-terminal domain-containing protein [Campylobacteraceae bacterium]